MSKLCQAELRSGGNRDLMLLGVKANGAVKGRLLVMTLEQRYRNSSDRNTEITYTFPLPFGAVLMEVEVTLNGQVLTGEVSPKTIARARYEEALSEGNSSIMLEKNADGSFSLELGNLMAREECNILVRYAQVLATEHGQVRLMLPTTIAPRFGNPVTQGKLQPHKVPVTELAAEYPFSITLTLMGNMANTNVACPSHKTSYLRNKDDLIISLSQRGCLDRDFILVINNLKNESDAMACNDLYAEDQCALMAFFSPRITTGESKTLSAKVLVDCSSSMAGDSIEAARRALLGIVSGLNKDDKFSLSKFGDTVEHRSRGMWHGTEQAKASAKRWIDNVRANLGGTEMEQALVSTIPLASGEKCDILLITDGEISGIDEVIEAAKKSKHRVFIVAIGASPAEIHLRRLAAETGGYCDFVSPGEDVEPAVLRMSSRMHAARAYDIRVEWPKSLTMRWEQKVQKFAFEDDVFNVSAFVQTPADVSELTSVKLWGCIEGQVGEVLLGEANLSFTKSSTNILARLAAYSRCQELEIEGEIADGSVDISNAQTLAVTYKLVTDQTNFILVHERTQGEKAQEMPDSHQVPQMLAAGWGGTGSVVCGRSIASPMSALRTGCDNVSFSGGSTSPDYGSMATPSVWRSSRVKASASLDSLSDDGMEDYEIPAFLRKYPGGEGGAHSSGQKVRQGIDKRNPLLWVPRDVLGARKSLERDFAFHGMTPAGVEYWMTINHQSLWPKTYAELLDLGLAFSICEWLEFDIGINREESAVVMAFLNVVNELGLANSVGFKGAVMAIKRAISSSKSPAIDDEISVAIRTSMKGVSAQRWPKAIVDFPEIATA